ncbi:MAG: hypothetical protein HY265_02220 [Deltaproteobacteria bacterium]|nr:hypothetical protein [Deltaproteobacteria bacterium]
MKTIMRLLTAFFMFIIFFAYPQFVFAGIQINSHAKYADGGFISEAVVYYIITNPQGQKLGYDPRTNQDYKEFKGGYGTEGIDEFYTADMYFTPIDGNYTIEAIGDGLMAFSIDVSIYREIKGEGFAPNMVVQGLTDKGFTSKFQFTYTSDPSKPAGTATRIATPSSLKQDITLSRKIGWIDNDGIMMSLYKKAEAIEKSISKGDATTAKNQIEAFINEVNAQKDKHITDKSAQILLEDAQYLMEHL